MGAVVSGMQEAVDGTSVEKEFDRGGVTRVARYGSIPVELGGDRSMKRSPQVLEVGRRGVAVD
jgi:hypothetical protein